MSIKKFLPFHKRKQKIFFSFILFAIFVFCSLFASCKKETDYSQYVSELRSNILLCENGELSVRVYAVEKESPYAPDGVKREISKRTELYLQAPSGECEYILSFSVNGKNYHGDAVYDNVKGEYYFSCSADVSTLTTLPILIEFEENKIEMNAKSVRSETMLSPLKALEKLQTENAELFTSLTDKYGFAGEIYIRLIFEDSAYYYFGIIEKSGKITAFLMNAESGKILAKREG